MRNSYKIFVRGLEGKRPLGRSRCRWEGNFIMDLRETVKRCGLDVSGSEHGPVAGCCVHCNKPSGSIKGGELLD
jgi:hypothetical protein